jgi:hypothetical protein
VSVISDQADDGRDVCHGINRERGKYALRAV